MSATTNVIHDCLNDLPLQRQVTTVWKGDWTTVPWSKSLKIVQNLRRRIFRATQAGDLNRTYAERMFLVDSNHNMLWFSDSAAWKSGCCA